MPESECCTNGACRGYLLADEDNIKRCAICGKTPEQAAATQAEIKRYHNLGENKEQILRDGEASLSVCLATWNITELEYHKLTDALKRSQAQWTVDEMPNAPPEKTPKRGAYLQEHGAGALLKRQQYLLENIENIRKTLLEEGAKAAAAKYGFSSSWLRKKQVAGELPIGKDQARLLGKPLTSIIKSTPGHTERHAYIEDHVADIASDMKTMSVNDVRAKWDLSSSTMSRLLREGKLPRNRRQYKTHKPPQARTKESPDQVAAKVPPSESSQPAPEILLSLERILKMSNAGLDIVAQNLNRSSQVLDKINSTPLPAQTLPQFRWWWFPSVQREWLKTARDLAALDVAMEALRRGVPPGK